MKDWKLIEREIKWLMYIFDKGEFEALAESQQFLDHLTPRSREQLGMLNLHVPAGETRSLSFALRIDNDEIPVDGYVLSLKLIFNTGEEYELSQAIGLSGKGSGGGAAV